MRLLVAIAVLFGCRDAQQSDDAGTAAQTDAPPWTGCPCAQVPTGVPSCGGSTCGNGQLDTCYTQSPMGCHCVMVLTETCDGNVTCEQLGFYGGEAACASNCLMTNTTACEACAPTNVECGKHATGTPRAVAVSGSHVAVATSSGIEIFGGVTHVTKVNVTDARALVGVPNGWLVVTDTGPSLSTLDTAGVRGTPATIASPDTAMVAGPNGRVLLTWRAFVGAQWRGFFAITGTDGSVIVPSTDLSGVGDRAPAAATDGTSFFVGVLGQLARIAPDGTSTIVTGFPIQDPASYDDVRVTWAGTTGWYVSWNAHVIAFVAQRFDATGAKVGNPLSLNFGLQPVDFLADGDDLLVLRRVNKNYEIVRVTAAGVVSAATEVGAFDGFIEFGRLAHHGTNVLAAWYRQNYLQLALAAPL